VLVVSAGVRGDEYEYQLMEHLLSGYDPRIRPSINSSEPLNVTFGLALAQIIDVVSIMHRTRAQTLLIHLFIVKSIYQTYVRSAV